MTDKPMVLVVDDDEDLRTLAEIQLGDRFEVITAADGQACLSLAASMDPDVILLDVMMPSMDGAQVMAALSADPRTENIPVIFLSALSSIEDRVKGLEVGAVDYISKPADAKEFVARVSAAARTAQRHQRASSSPPSDPLTGLEQRRSFERRLSQEVARSRRAGTPVSICLIDIDDLSGFNASWGRASGDKLLVRIATLLRDTLRSSDIVFRYGEDEFAVILPDAEVGTAFLAIERFREALGRAARDARSTVSVGLAELVAGRSADELLAKAEVALFRAKESGGDRAWRSDDPRRHGLNPSALAGELTDREWSVIKMLVDKRTEQDIADQMGIRPGTVRSHKARIRRKLNVSPEVRLSEFVRNNFRDLVARIGDIDIYEEHFGR